MNEDFNIRHSTNFSEMEWKTLDHLIYQLLYERSIVAERILNTPKDVWVEEYRELKNIYRYYNRQIGDLLRIPVNQ
jgi:hypothetical protein